MPKLLNCAECGKKVSSEASICPHCNKSPKIVKCKFCSETLNQSQSRVYQDNYFHVTCISKFQESYNKNTELVKASPLKIKCQACKYTFTRDYEEAGDFPYDSPRERDKKTDRITCKSCGHPCTILISSYDWPYANCYVCKKILNSSDKGSIRLEVKYFDSRVRSGIYVYIHRFCGDNLTKERTIKGLKSNYFIEKHLGKILAFFFGIIVVFCIVSKLWWLGIISAILFFLSL
jgi:hypothetical protein